MFAIYSVEGLQQRDTLEKLLALRVSASNKAKSQTSSDDAESAPTNDPSTAPSDTAIRAYRKVLNVDAREKIVHAHQIMTRPVRSIPISESTEAAWRTFSTFDIRQATIVNDHGAIVGMLSTEDLLKAVIIEGTDVKYTHRNRVREIMSREVWTAEPVTDVRRIAQAMDELRLNAVPIVNGAGEVAGIVSRTDILRALTKGPPISLWT